MDVRQMFDTAVSDDGGIVVPAAGVHARRLRFGTRCRQNHDDLSEHNGIGLDDNTGSHANASQFESRNPQWQATGPTI
jgi:hypothetical protein